MSGTQQKGFTPPAEMTVDFDQWSGKLNRYNVWDIYRSMRKRAAALYTHAGEGFWMVTRYADIRNAAMNYKVFSSANGARIGFHRPLDPRAAPIEYDPPDHKKFRSVMIAPFAPSKIGNLTGLVDGHVQALVDRALERGTFDIVQDLGAPLAVNVISDIIGFDAETRERNRQLARAVLDASHAGATAAHVEYDLFLQEEVRKRLEKPDEGWLGQTAATREFTESELLSMVRAMALAGHHTTVNGVSSMLYWYSKPEIRERWLSSNTDDPQVIAGFVNESLRIDPPIHMEARWTTEDVEFEDAHIPVDQQVALVYASGNRDETVFENPDEFIPTRSGGHLSFGHGIHTCLGMALAKLEMTQVLIAVLAKMPNLRLTEKPVDSGFFFGHHMGWTSMPAAIE